MKRKAGAVFLAYPANMHVYWYELWTIYVHTAVNGVVAIHVGLYHEYEYTCTAFTCMILYGR